MTASNPDAMVRYCPECGTIGPVRPPALTCCPDSFGMSMPRWQAEKLERMLEALRQRANGAAPTAPAEFKAVGKADFHMSAELDVCIGDELFIRSPGVEKLSEQEPK